MQNLTTPLANIETNTMLFGSARMEMTVFGVLVFQFRQFAFPDLPGRIFSLCQFAFSAFVAFPLLRLPLKAPEAFWKLSQKLSPKGKKTRKVDMTAALETPGSFLDFLPIYAQKQKTVHKHALCGTRRKSMCHGCAGRFLGRLLKFPGSFP